MMFKPWWMLSVNTVATFEIKKQPQNHTDLVIQILIPFLMIIERMMRLIPGVVTWLPLTLPPHTQKLEHLIKAEILWF
jgi:hypothetical protein